MRPRSEIHAPDYYRRVSIGVVGTAMPAFETAGCRQDRWAVALYASVLRLPNDSGSVPPGLQIPLEVPAGCPIPSCSTLWGRGMTEQPVSPGLQPSVDSADATAAADTRVFTEVRAQIESVYALARAGDSSASTRAFDAYMTFEQVERSVRAKNPELAAELEAAFAALRTRVAGGATGAELDRIRRQLDADWRTPSGHWATSLSQSTCSYSRLSFCCGKA